MTASEWQTLGWILLAGGGVILTLSQILLSRWHKKMLSDL